MSFHTLHAEVSVIFGYDTIASGTYAVMMACVCMYVCMYVCMCVRVWYITIEDSNKGIPSPRSTIEWEQLVLDRHTMGELE